MKKYILLLFIAISLFVACGKKTTTPTTTTTPPAQVINDSFEYYMNKLTGKGRFIYYASRVENLYLDSFSFDVLKHKDSIFNFSWGLPNSTPTQLYTRVSKLVISDGIKNYFTTDSALYSGGLSFYNLPPWEISTPFLNMDSLAIFTASIFDWKSSCSRINYYCFKDSVVYKTGYNFNTSYKDSVTNTLHTIIVNGSANTSIYKLTN